MISCPSCGADNPDGFKFCGHCAASLIASPSIAEERKVVTTLFCDLVAYTAMTEAADPEDVAAVLRRYHDLVTRIIESHGGVVEKFIGDAVVGVFGVPLVREDDAERGVRAALRILQAIHEARLERPDDGRLLEVRVGVNTGEAVIRLDVSPASGTGFLTGDAVTVAARLQSAAPPMGVLVGALTRELSQRAVEYEQLEPVPAKGKAEPVQAWLARRPFARTGLRTSGMTTTPFLGRDAELAALEQALAQATSARSARSVLLLGEPGIGKSRLVLEFARMLDRQPAMVTWRQGHCLPYGDGVTFWALGEVVKEHAGIIDLDGVARVEAKLEAAALGGDDDSWLVQRLRPLVGLDAPSAGREENFTAWTRFLQTVAAAGPAVVVLEDLHWADEGMLAFVDHLLAQDIAAPLLLIATARPELLDRHPEALLCRGSDRCKRQTLRTLSARHSGTLVSHLADVGLPPQVQKQIVEAVGGNPLYAEQYVRLLLDRELAVERRDKGPDARLPVPQTLHAVLAARLDTLAPAHKALLADAAVLGETFSRSGVVAVSGRDEAEVDVAMQVLLARDVVRPVRTWASDGEPEYLFWHALTRDVAYGQLPRLVRARKHQAAAAWVAGLADGRGEDFAEIEAHHATTALDLATAAGDEQLSAQLVPSAIDALRRAGERGLRLDTAAAERHFARALELAGEDCEARTRLLPGWAQVLLLTNRYRDAAAAYDEAVDQLKVQGRLRPAALALCWSADAYVYLNEPALERSRAAVDLLADDGPSAELAEILSHYALGLSIHDDDARLVIATADRAIEMGRLLELPDAAVALSTRGLVRCSCGDLGGLEDCRRAEAAARAQGLGIERSTIMINHASLRFLTDGAEAERDAVLETVAFASSHGIATHAGACESSLIDCTFRLGDWSETLAKLATLLPELEVLEDEWDLLFLRSLRAFVLNARGELPAAREDIDWLTSRGLVCEVGWARGYALLASAVVRCAERRMDEASGLLHDCFVRPRAALAIVDALPAAVRTALAVGDEDLAARLVGEVASLSSGASLPLYQHVVTTGDGLLRENREEYQAAAESFARAGAGWRTFAVPYEEAQALLGQGRCLVALGKAEEARQALGEAREIFEHLGAKPALEETAELLGRLSNSSQV